MNINRNSFLESFALTSPALKLIFMNHLGVPSKLLTDISTIELLADKTAMANAFAQWPVLDNGHSNFSA